LEILEYIGDTYWSSDYIVEIQGYEKVAKFVEKSLIKSQADAILRSELARNVHGLIVPEIFYFEEGERDILVYDIPSYDSITRYGREHVEKLLPQLLSIMKTVLHIPGLSVPYMGLDDLVIVNDEIRIFLPLIQSFEHVESMAKTGKVFAAPEYFRKEITDKSTIYVFGKIIHDLTSNEELKRIVQRMIVEEPSQRDYVEEIPFQNVFGSKKILTIRRIHREEENQIVELVLRPLPGQGFIGVIGPQRIGKTTMIENLQSNFRQKGIPFLHVTSGSDLIAQTLQVCSDKVSEKLVSSLSYCLENVCTIDTVSIDVVQALTHLDNVVIFVDDYQEAGERLKSFLRRLARFDSTGKIKILAFSVEDSEDFHLRVELKAFDKHTIKRLLDSSFLKIQNQDILVDWLYAASGGLPGLIVEYLRYLYEQDVLRKEHEGFVFDAERLEEVRVESIFVERVEKFKNSNAKYLSVLGQKFNLVEVETLEKLLGENIDLTKLLEDGILYREYNIIRFTLKQYWEILYESIVEEERLELHKKLASSLADYEKKAWHLESSGNEVSAAVAYLKYAMELLNFYASPSVIYAVLQKARKILKNRESYAYYKFLLELAERTEDENYIRDLDIPDKKIYVYLKSFKYYLVYDYKNAVELLKNSHVELGPFGNLKREFLLLRSEVGQAPGRKDYYERAKRIMEQLDENNPLHVRLLIDIYIFMSVIARSNPSKALEYLRKAEKLALDYNVAHKLPSIYNNIAVEITNTTISMQYLERAVEAAENIGLPARSYLARLNILSHALYAGKIGEFISGIAELEPKLEMLNLRNEIIFAQTLEAYYHSYNFEVEEALEHIKRIKERYGVDSSFDIFAVHFITRNLPKAMEYKQSVLSSEEYDESTKEIVEVISAAGTEEFAIKWKKYRDAGSRYFREEIVAVLGNELARTVPELFKEELEYLETNYVLDGALLSLAMVYEGFGHYYKALGNEYKSKSYYSKAITIYKDIGLENAARMLCELYGVELEKDEKEKHSKQLSTLSYDLLSSLKAIDPKTEPEKLLNYFAAKVLSLIPARSLLFRLYDKVLDKTFETSLGTADREKPVRETLSVAPLEVYVNDKIDKNATYELWLSNQNVRFPEEYKNELLPILQLLEYSFVAVMKGTLTWLRSLIDPLTKLSTRYHFSEVLQHYFEKAQSEQGELSVVMCDIDNFKRINDTYGHLTGDAVLKEVARILRDNVRSTDVVGRFGGEEFVLLFPSTGEEEAKTVVERLRRLTRDLNKFPFNITLSYGIAVYPACKVNDSEELIQKADIALYHAKNTGKDKIVVYTEGMSGGLHA